MLFEHPAKHTCDARTPQSRPLELEVTRRQFEGLVGLLLLQLQVVVEQTLERAHKTPSDIQKVLLCGGSSRIPAVQEMLARFFGRQPEATLDLDLSVALGAAYQAAAYSEVLGEAQSQNLESMPHQPCNFWLKRDW